MRNIFFHRNITNEDIIIQKMSSIIDLTTEEHVTPFLDLTNDDNGKLVTFKRIFVDLSNEIDDVLLPIVKRPRRASGINEYLHHERLLDNLRNLPRELLMKIFDDYLDVIFIKEILMTPTDILRATICIHHSIESRIVPSKALTDISTLSKFIIEHIRERAMMFIIFAMRNSVVVPTLQVNDLFDYYEPNKYGKYVVLKVFKSSAIVQRIKYQEKKLYYNGMVFNTVVKVSQKRRISKKILNNRCIFNPEREQSVCFINNLGTPTEIVYYSDVGLIVEKHRNMSNYIIE